MHRILDENSDDESNNSNEVLFLDKMSTPLRKQKLEDIKHELYEVSKYVQKVRQQDNKKKVLVSGQQQKFTSLDSDFPIPREFLSVAKDAKRQ